MLELGKLNLVKKAPRFTSINSPKNPNRKRRTSRPAKFCTSDAGISKIINNAKVTM